MRGKRATDQEAFERLHGDYPFLTYIKYSNCSVIGIVQNTTSQFVMVFDYSLIRNNEEKKRFLELGERWWYESNTKVPIDVFFGDKFEDFRYILKGYSKKEVKEIIGPTINLSEIYNKRVKRRRIEFMKEVD